MTRKLKVRKENVKDVVSRIEELERILRHTKTLVMEVGLLDSITTDDPLFEDLAGRTEEIECVALYLSSDTGDDDEMYIDLFDFA